MNNVLRDARFGLRLLLNIPLARLNAIELGQARDLTRDGSVVRSYDLKRG